jgi:hypothetical protein
MNEAQTALWLRICKHDLDRAAAYPFTARLAAENGWSALYALQVIEEYRRFCFLAAAAGHPVSPSDAVDQAWHLHLLYTDDYWNVWCTQVLCHQLHHGPTKGGLTETKKYGDWYGHTLESYRIFFRCTPPENLWPPYAEATKHVRVDARLHWILPKPAKLLRKLKSYL